MHISLLQMLGSATQPPSRPATASAAASSPSSTTTSTSTSSSSAPGVDLTQTFLQLLSVQLENQSPLNPIDPNQFTSQLAQFDSLGELTQIQSLMQTLVNDVGGSSSTASGSSANTNSIGPNNASSL